jgi:two-component system, OmpR family, phosphate regulon response regulator OmpR
MSSRLLLIDDDTRLTEMVGDYLRRNGFEVDVAGSLAQGRDRLKQGTYDALLLDGMLPDGDGLDLTRELRGQPRTRRLPLLMLTARGEPMDRILGLEIGADDYLGKPFEPRAGLAAQFAGQVQTIAVGQHAVQQQGVVSALFEPVAALGE